MAIVIVGLVLGLILREFLKQEVVCKDCGFVGKLLKAGKGNELIALILLCCFIIPGIIYIIWSQSNRGFKCPKCSSWNVIPANSPQGVLALRQIRSATEVSPAQGNKTNDSEAKKTCPQCAEEVKSAARICKHCRFEFQGA